MRISFSDKAKTDYAHWVRHDKKMVGRIIRLLEDIRRAPFRGLGKPEPLKHNWQGFWSRRIDAEHRLVYRIKDDTIEIAQCRFHYDE